MKSSWEETLCPLPQNLIWVLLNGYKGQIVRVFGEIGLKTVCDLENTIFAQHLLMLLASERNSFERDIPGPTIFSTIFNGTLKVLFFDFFFIAIYAIVFSSIQGLDVLLISPSLSKLSLDASELFLWLASIDT